MQYPILNFVAPKYATMTKDEIKERLKLHLLKLRERKTEKGLGLPDTLGMSEKELMEALDALDLTFEDVNRAHQKMKLSAVDGARLERRAGRFALALQDAVLHLSDIKPLSDRNKVIRASHGVDAVSVSADEIDAIAAQIHEDMPWMDQITTHIMRRGRACAAAGKPFHLAPIIIDGGPGIGKTHFAQMLGDYLRLPTLRVDLGHEGIMGLAGLERGWSGARSGVVVETMLSRRIANPLVIIDELARGTEEVPSNNRTIPGPHSQLLAMIEPETARTWRCPYYGVEVDLRGVSWIMTTNGTERIPAPLLSRCRVFKVGPLTRDHLRQAALAMSRGRLPSDIAEIVARSVWRAAVSRRMDLRHVARAIERSEEVQAYREMLH